MALSDIWREKETQLSRRLLRKVSAVLTDDEWRLFATIVAMQTEEALNHAFFAAAPPNSERPARILNAVLSDTEEAGDLASVRGRALIVAGIPTVLQADGAFDQRAIEQLISDYGLGTSDAQELRVIAQRHGGSLFHTMAELGGAILPDVLEDAAKQLGGATLKSAVKELAAALEDK